jgi:RHS repeat-associated protein
MTLSVACANGAASRTPYLFTGKERDTESGNDYFGARYYASSMGRFLSPDPKAASGHAADPQTWNRYAYTDNNPLKFIDPNGLEKFLVIYIQQPVEGKNTSHVGDNVGHSFVGLRDTDTNKEVKIGYYPKPGTSIEAAFGNDVSGAFKNNDKHGYNVRLEFKISDEQFKSLVNAAFNSTLAPNKYNIRTHNCTDWVIDLAKSVGINLPHEKGDSSHPNNPGSLGWDMGGMPGVDRTKHEDAATGSLDKEDPNQTSDMKPLKELHEEVNKSK